MRRRPQDELEPLDEANAEGHERGDTLVEVLLAVVVLGLAGVALLLGFATSITSSAEHRHLATLDASVRAASDEVIAQVQDATDNAFGPTACSSPYHPTWTLSGSVHVTSYSVWYWNGSNFASGNPCTNYGPQQWTMNLSDGSYTTSVTTVIYDPQAPTVIGGTTPAKLVFVLPSTQNPGTGTINAPVSPPPLVAVEDTANNIVYGDASAVSLSVTSGPGTLSSNCVGSENTGLFSFSGCSFSAVGTYTITATDSNHTVKTATANYTITSAPPAKLAITTTAVTGTASNSPTLGPITIQEQDAFGNPDPGGLTVSLSSSSSTGIFSLTSGGALVTSVSIPAGQSTVSVYYGDTASGTPTLSAASPGLQTGTQTETINPGPEKMLAVSTQPPGTLAAGQSFTVGVTVEDQYGNPITTGFTGSSDTIHVALSSGSFASGTTSVPASNGVATFGNLQITSPATYTITATDTTHVSVASTTTNPFTVIPAPPSKLVFTSAASGTYPVGTTANVGAFQVQVQDPYGNAVTNTGSPVVLSLTSSSTGTAFFTPTSGASSAGSAVIPTGASSSSTFYYGDTQSGKPQITAAATVNGHTVNGTTAANSFTMTPGPENKLAITTQPAAAVAAGSSFTVGVTVEDQYGNTIASGTGSTDSLHVALSSGTFSAGTTTRTASGGVASFTGLQITTPGTYTVTATDSTTGTVTSATTNSITVNPASPSKLVITSQPASPITAGGTVSVGVTLEDTYGNVITTGNTGSTDTIHVALSSGSFASGTTSVAASNGVATFSGLQITSTAGSPYTITASDASRGGVSTATTSSVTVNPAAENKLAVTTQPPASVTAGQTFAVGVTVEDSYGNPITTGNTGSTDTIQLALSSGSFASGTISVSASNGVASFSGLSVTAAGTYTITATDSTNGAITAATTNSITVKPASPNNLVITSQPASPITAGGTVSVGVTLEDQYGNVITTGNTGSTDTIHVALSSGSFASGTTSVAASNGVATFSGLQITSTAGSPYTITASDASRGGVSTATTSSVTVNPAAANKMAFVVSPGTTTAGNAISPAVTAQVQDTFGNAVADNGATVTMSVASGPGGFTGTSTTSATTNASGLATFNNLVLNTSGSTYKITAASSGLASATSGTFTVNPAAANKMTFVVSPGTTTAGNAISPAVTAQVQDTFGNAVADNGATVTMSVASGPGGFTGTSTTSATTNASGLATFNNLVLNTSGSYTVTVASSGLASATSGSFTVNPGAPAKLVFTTTVTGNHTVGTTANVGPFAVQVQDNFNNPVPNAGAAVTLTLTSSSTGSTFFTPTPGGSSAGAVTIANGASTSANFYYADTQSGSPTITASGTVNGSGASGTLIGSFTMTPAAANKMAFVVSPGTTTAGNAISPAVTAQVQDTFGNAVADNGATVTMSVASGPGGFTGTSTTSATTNASGLATFNNLVLNTSGSTYKITAASSGLASATSGTFTVNPAAANKMTFVVSPGTTTAGNAISPAVTAQVQDTFGNAVADNGATVTMSVASGPGGFTGTSTTSVTTNASGLATFNNLVLNTSGSYTVTVASSGLASATSGSFTVNPAAANKMAFVVSPGTTTAGNAISPAVTAQVQDTFGNAVADNGATVTMSVASGPGGFTGTSTTSATTNASGLATFNNLVLNTSGSTYKITAASSGLASATSGTFTVNPAAANKMTFVVSPGTTTAGNAISPAVTAQVQDTFGNAVADNGATVTMSVASGPGGFTGTSTTSATTNASGLATFNNLVLNTSGSYTVTVASSGLASATSGSFTVNPGAPAKLVFTTTVTGNHTVGTTANVGPFAVQVQDNFNNPVPNAGAAVTLTLTSSSTGSTFFTPTPGGSSAGAVTIANGASTSANFYYADTQSGSPTITASGTVNGSGASGTLIGSFTMTPAAANKMAFVVSPGTTTAGNAISPAVTAQVQDTFGNAVADNGATVTMSVASGPGGFTGTSTTSATTNASGLATFNNLVLNTSGSTYKITAASSGLASATSGTFTVNPAAANKMTFVVSPGTTTAGNAISPAVTAQVQDTFGNAVADNGATVTMSVASGPGGFTGTSTTSATTNASGLATFNNLVLNTSGSTYKITAASSGLASATSGSFTVNPGAPAKLVFTTTVTGNHTVGTTANVGPFAVQVQDNFNNPVPNAGAAVTLTLTSSSTGSTFFTPTPGGSSAGAVTIANGASTSANFYYADTQSGSPTITASGTVNGSGASGTLIGSFTMTPAAANKMAFVVSPGTTTAGNAISPAVTAQVQDTFGNAVADNGATVTMSVASGPGGFTGTSTTSATTNASGLATFNNLVLNTSGSTYKITAASSGLAAGTSGSFTVLADVTQSMSANGSGTSSSATLTSTPASGTTLIVLVYTEGGVANPAAPSSINGSAVSSSTLITTAQPGGLGSHYNEWAYTVTATGTGKIVTANFAASQTVTEVDVMALNGTVSGTPTSHTNTGTSRTPTATLLATPGAGDLEAAMFGTAGQNGSLGSTPGGWTNVGALTGTNGGHAYGEGSYFTNTNGSTSQAFSIGNSVQWATIALDIAVS